MIDLKRLDSIDRSLVARALGLPEDSPAEGLFGPYRQYRVDASHGQEKTPDIYFPAHAKVELDYDERQLIREGSKGPQVKRIQEHLVLLGKKITIDGDFGPATARALKGVIVGEGGLYSPLAPVVTKQLWDDVLTEKMRGVIMARPTMPNGSTLTDWVHEIAQTHLDAHPVEVGGQNRGPWVRLYMDGHEGASWPWCAGFVTYVLRQVAALRREDPLLPGSFSCDVLAARGKAAGKFVKGPVPAADPRERERGFIFLVRKSANDWTHTGFGFDLQTNGTFRTIEGNTNDEGSREGYEVCSRVRSSRNMDFILL